MTPQSTSECVPNGHILLIFGVGEMPQVNQVLPSSSPTVPSLPDSPDRPGSASPFAPSAADLPSMPEPALTCRGKETGEPGALKEALETGPEEGDFSDSQSWLRTWASHAHG